MDYRDGICALTRKQSEGCIVVPPGVVYSNREVLLSEEGVNELEKILDNPDAHWQDSVCCITAEKSECVAIWGRLGPKRSIMLSKAGVSILKEGIKSRPSDYAKKDPEAVKETAPVPPVPPPASEPEAPPAEEVPLAEVTESKALAEIRVDREVAEMNLEEAEKALADKSEGDDEEALASAVEGAKARLEEAKAAEEAKIIEEAKAVK